MKGVFCNQLYDTKPLISPINQVSGPEFRSDERSTLNTEAEMVRFIKEENSLASLFIFSNLFNLFIFLLRTFFLLSLNLVLQGKIFLLRNALNMK